MTSTFGSGLLVPAINGRQLTPPELLWLWLAALDTAQKAGVTATVVQILAAGSIQVASIEGAAVHPALTGTVVYLSGAGLSIDGSGQLHGTVSGFGILAPGTGFQETTLFQAHTVQDMLAAIDPARPAPDPGGDPVFHSLFVATPAHLYSFYGTELADTAAVMPGVNSLWLGDGNDRAILGSSSDGSGTLRGEDGLDTLDAWHFTSDLDIDLGAFTLITDGGLEFRVEGFEGVIGGSGHDRMRGSDAAETMTGAAGNEVMRGRMGNDRLEGEQGHDRLYGEAGNDILTGLTGRDSLFGGAGDDDCFGGMNDDRISGGAGNDSLNGGRGNDSLWGEAGKDTLAGGRGDDLLLGGGGRDRLLGGEGADTLEGGTGNDTLAGGSGADVFLFGPAHQGDRDKILDYTPGEDSIFLWTSDISGYTARTDGSDTVIDLQHRNGSTSAVRVVDAAPEGLTILWD